MQIKSSSEILSFAYQFLSARVSIKSPFRVFDSRTNDVVRLLLINLNYDEYYCNSGDGDCRRTGGE